jgi:hypothetical protein
MADMIRAGTDATYPDGHSTVNGIVIGFMKHDRTRGDFWNDRAKGIERRSERAVLD